MVGMCRVECASMPSPSSLTRSCLPPSSFPGVALRCAAVTPPLPRSSARLCYVLPGGLDEGLEAGVEVLTRVEASNGMAPSQQMKGMCCLQLTLSNHCLREGHHAAAGSKRGRSSCTLDSPATRERRRRPERSPKSTSSPLSMPVVPCFHP